jgi:hypothetical protein
MGLTLDQLLDETGVNDLTGTPRLAKTAAVKPDFAKLAERCRLAANATPADVSASDHQDMAEKTAAIAVISRTLSEIHAIDGGAPSGGQEKTAAAAPAGFDPALFIKTALERGHDPMRIAEFLEKQGGLLGRIGMRIDEARAGSALSRGAKMREQAQGVGGKGVARLHDLLRKGEALDDAKRDALVSRIRVNHGDELASHLGLAEHKSYKDLPSAKGLKKAAPPGAPAAGTPAPKALGVNVGGHSLGVTADQLGKLKKPAAYAGAGYLGHKALSGGGGDKDDSKKRGVVVVNS